MSDSTATKVNPTLPAARLIVIEQRVRDVLARAGADYGVTFKLAGDFMVQLDEEVEALVLRAAERGRDNGRNTLSARDL